MANRRRKRAGPSRATEQTTEPLVTMRNVQAQLGELIGSLKKDMESVNEPKAQAFFETAAEILTCLATTAEHYQEKSEPAWR